MKFQPWYNMNGNYVSSMNYASNFPTRFMISGEGNRTDLLIKGINKRGRILPLVRCVNCNPFCSRSCCQHGCHV